MIRYKKGSPKVKINVENHFKFRRFEYVSESNDNCQLGVVVYKPSERSIGVVIQTFSDGDFRTDMFGNASASEVRFATLEEIKKYRPDLIVDLVD